LGPVLSDANEDICGKHIAADGGEVAHTMEEYITLFKIIVYIIGTEIIAAMAIIIITIKSSTMVKPFSKHS